ncbi:MAG: HAD-IC family P-type ATPase, partial [Clostridia bacterium]
TQNKMTTKELFVDGKLISCGDMLKNDDTHNTLLHAMVIVNDSTNINGEEIGDPTEVALTNLGKVYGINEVEYRVAHPRISELAFDSDRKLMSVLQREKDKTLIFTKGAFDVLLKRATHILTSSGVRKIEKSDIDGIESANYDLSSRGQRLLAFAYKECPKGKENITLEDEYDYVFVGLVSMIDPPREESKQAVTDARTAGIKPIMITGDHKVTASAIAQQIGIFEDGDMALDGLELTAMSDAELDEILPKVSVYARVSPEHKIRIVDAWQRRGNIVSMTGDGVNDAPALKKADIGVAMGITGTEVSKDAADMILTDDNFATIVKSVTNGRNVYNNIKNAIAFLLSGNMAGILCILITSLAGWP